MRSILVSFLLRADPSTAADAGLFSRRRKWLLRCWFFLRLQGGGRMWSSSQASTRGVIEVGRVEAGPSHFPKRPAPRNSSRLFFCSPVAGGLILGLFIVPLAQIYF